MPLFLAVGGCSAIFVIIPVWRISEKAGYGIRDDAIVTDLFMRTR
ncbi:MAG: hypothetical protein ACP5VF_08490 [Acidobacteriota bacterium]